MPRTLQHTYRKTARSRKTEESRADLTKPTILQRHTITKTKYSYQRPHPKPHQVNAYKSHVHRDAAARTRSLGG